MRLLTAVAVVFVLATPAGATTYYVSTSGNDANVGSLDAPFRTMTRAAVVAQPGDLVNVRAGVYTEPVAIFSKGTAAAPIVFQAMPGEQVVLDGSSHASRTPVVELTRTEHVDFSGFEVRNSPYIGIVLWYARSTRVLGNHIHHTTRNGIYAGGDATGDSSDITVSGNTVHNTVLENQYHTMTTGGWAGAVVVSKTEGATITDNRIWNNDGEGVISLRSNHTLIRNNEIFDNFSVYLYLDNSRFVTADRNLIYSTGNTRYFRNGAPGAGIGIANETKSVMNPSSDNVFTNNIVIGTRWGFYYGNYESGGGLRNTRVLNNTFYGTTDEIVRVEADAHSNSVIANNIFYQTGSPTPRYAGAGPVAYQNNVWYGGSAGPAAGVGDIIGDPRLANPGTFTADGYKLTAFSPAIAAGANVPAVDADFWGTARGPLFDIGAHQYSAAASTPLADTEVPSMPANVTATASVTAAAITLTWSPSTDNVAVTAYAIHRDGSAVATVPTPGWTDAGLTWSTTYHYTVSAMDAAGNVSAQQAVAATTISNPAAAADTQPPTAPTGFWAAPSTSSPRMYLGWSASSDNVGVTAYRITRNGAPVAIVTGTTWTDESGLTWSTAYSYAVSALDAAGNESTQATESATTIADPTPAADTQAPTAPGGFQVSPSTSAARMHLGWSASSDNVGVTVYRVTRDGLPVATVTGTTWTDDSGLAWSTAYLYAVSALDAAGNESPQTTATATTIASAPPVTDTQAPTVPGGFWISPSSSSTRMYLGWSASSDNVGVVGYRIYRNGTLVATITGTAWTDDSGLKRKTRYSYAVSAFDAAGNASAHTGGSARTNK